MDGFGQALEPRTDQRRCEGYDTRISILLAGLREVEVKEGA
jgi:hypothetical protein